ncbi:uncharacterized protein LOC107611170 [Arachis ipaensis]|uniref:uncharacterized protein LOC107611170 n=1 Tax=Arachis ipaensis TaxID=130454 RepID=UPI0007AF6609|nr:uncharacterized protein LOC107611170 [Arachis ipaensis]
MSDDEINQLCLMDIDKILHSYGKTLKDYPPMPLATEVDSSLLTKRVIREELNFNRDDLNKNTSDMLAITPPEQKYAFDKIVTAVLPPHKLILKVGVPVMLLKNIDRSSGLCNCTRLQVRKLGNYVIECEVLMGNNIGHIALIPRMNMVPTNETVPVRFQRRQFSIIVSFAMTINKSQGQTLSHVGLYHPHCSSQIIWHPLPPSSFRSISQPVPEASSTLAPSVGTLQRRGGMADNPEEQSSNSLT